MFSQRRKTLLLQRARPVIGTPGVAGALALEGAAIGTVDSASTRFGPGLARQLFPTGVRRSDDESMNQISKASATERQIENTPVNTHLTAKIHKALELALRSPSGDNSQPWRFHLNVDTLEIGIDQPLAIHTFNNRNHASLIGIGMLVESIALISPELGLHAEVHWLVSEFANLDQKAPWVKIAFTSAPLTSSLNEQTTWQAAIQSRSTERGDFSATGIVLSNPKFQFVKQTDHQLVSASVLSGKQAESTETLMDFICTSEQYVFANSSALHDLLHWIRFGKAETEKTNDGMPWRTLGLKPTEAFVLRMLKRFPVLRKFFTPMFKVVIANQTRQKVGSAGGIVLLSVKSATPVAVFEAGRVAIRHWLQLEQLGLAVQPISAASLCVFDVASGAAPASMPVAYKTHYRNGLGTLMDAFCLDAGETPIWMYRFGQLKQRTAHKTPRRSLSSFFMGR